MANHKSAAKRIRQSDVKRLRNRYIAKTTRNSVRKLQGITDKEEAQKALPGVCSMVDKLAKKNVIHRNKAGNIKSKLTKRVNAL